MAVQLSKLLYLCLLAVPALVHGAQCPTPAAICNVSPPDNIDPHPHCGDRGELDPKKVRGEILRKRCGASFEECRDACLTNPKCKSFRTTPGTCTLYTDFPNALGFQAKKSSPQKFYNRRCFTFTRCVSSTSTTTSPTGTSTPAASYFLRVMPDFGGDVEKRELPSPKEGVQEGVKERSIAILAGKYLQIRNESFHATFVPTLREATKFKTDDDDCLLDGDIPGIPANIASVANTTFDAIHWRPEPEVDDSPDRFKVLCAKKNAGLSFICGAENKQANTLVSCDNMLHIYDSAKIKNMPKGCRSVTFMAIPNPDGDRKRGS